MKFMGGWLHLHIVRANATAILSRSYHLSMSFSSHTLNLLCVVAKSVWNIYNKKLNAYWSALFGINVNKAALIINLTTYTHTLTNYSQ